MVGVLAGTVGTRLGRPNRPHADDVGSCSQLVSTDLRGAKQFGEILLIALSPQRSMCVLCRTAFGAAHLAPIWRAERSNVRGKNIGHPRTQTSTHKNQGLHSLCPKPPPTTEATESDTNKQHRPLIEGTRYTVKTHEGATDDPMTVAGVASILRWGGVPETMFSNNQTDVTFGRGP